MTGRPGSAFAACRSIEISGVIPTPPAWRTRGDVPAPPGRRRLRPAPGSGAPRPRGSSRGEQPDATPLPPHGDLEVARVLRGGADRVAPDLVLPSRRDTHHQELPGPEREALRPLHPERPDLGRLVDDREDLHRAEAGGGGAGSSGGRCGRTRAGISAARAERARSPSLGREEPLARDEPGDLRREAGEEPRRHGAGPRRETAKADRGDEEQAAARAGAAVREEEERRDVERRDEREDGDGRVRPHGAAEDTGRAPRELRRSPGPSSE